MYVHADRVTQTRSAAVRMILGKSVKDKCDGLGAMGHSADRISIH